MKWKPIEFDIGCDIKITTDGTTTILSIEGKADKATALDEEAMVALRDACDASWKLLKSKRQS